MALSLPALIAGIAGGGVLILQTAILLRAPSALPPQDDGPLISRLDSLQAQMLALREELGEVRARVDTVGTQQHSVAGLGQGGLLQTEERADMRRRIEEAMAARRAPETPWTPPEPAALVERVAAETPLDEAQRATATDLLTRFQASVAAAGEDGEQRRAARDHLEESLEAVLPKEAADALVEGSSPPRRGRGRPGGGRPEGEGGRPVWAAPGSGGAERWGRGERAPAPAPAPAPNEF